jgi:enamine deaminase RidA (YjgF/YER057c/UK114 family)
MSNTHISTLPRRRILSESGPLIFTGAITPHDSSTGRLVTDPAPYVQSLKAAKVGLMFFDMPERPVLAQAWVAYQHLLALLKDRGLTPANIVRQRVFVRDHREVHAVERVMDLVLGHRPVTTIVVMATAHIHPELHVQLDCILCKDPQGIQRLSGDLASGYPPAVRVGDLLFTSAVSASTGPAGDAAPLASDDAMLRSDHHRRIYREASQTFCALREVLKQAGADIRDIVKVNGWVDFPMRDYGAAVLARRRFFDQTREYMMASTGLAVGGAADPDTMMSFDAVALIPGGKSGPKSVHPCVSPVASPYVAGAVEGGGLIFTSGEIPVLQPEGIVVSACEQLQDDGRLLRFGHIEPESGMESRAWFVHKTIEHYLAACGAGFGNVLHQTVFMKDSRLFPVLERVATLFYGRTLPPTTIVPITDTTPFPTSELEIEVIAAR